MVDPILAWAYCGDLGLPNYTKAHDRDVAGMSDYIETDYVSWSRAHFNMLADRGTWAIPRSGLVFQRRGEKLVLIARMPWDESMGITAARLRAYQDDDYDAIKLNFEKAGISVSDATDETASQRERWIIDPPNRNLT